MGCRMRPLFEERPNKLKVTYKSFPFEGDKFRDLSHKKCVYQGIQSACQLMSTEAMCLHLLALQSLATKLDVHPRKFALHPHISCDKTSLRA